MTVRPAPSRARAFFFTAVAPAWVAVRSRLPSILLIQAMGVALVSAYFLVPGFSQRLDELGEAKARLGLVFAVVGSYLAGAVFPEVARTLVGQRVWNWKRFADMNHSGLMFILNGVATEMFLRVQQWLHGSGSDPWTVAKKVATDAFAYTPLISLPIFLVLVLWREERWSLNGLCRRLNRSIIGERVIPILVPCWIYWIPLQACFYALPINLQYPTALMGIAAWSLILIFIAKREDIPQTTNALN